MVTVYTQLARSLQNIYSVMNNTLLNINWLVAIPLGFASLLFLWMGVRRGTRFFDHESNASQKERFRDLFLFVFNIISIAFCFLIAMSPTKMWLIMIPVGFTLCIFTVPISILGSYWRLYMIDGFMSKNAGIKINFSVPNEKPDEGIKWYEFTPFAFMLGWLVFFLVNVVMLLIVGNAQELSDFRTIVSIAVGIITGIIFVILGALFK
jgi:hypothetical protein